jgi:hypothetical protein
VNWNRGLSHCRHRASRNSDDGYPGDPARVGNAVRLLSEMAGTILAVAGCPAMKMSAIK